MRAVWWRATNRTPVQQVDPTDGQRLERLSKDMTWSWVAHCGGGRCNRMGLWPPACGGSSVMVAFGGGAPLDAQLGGFG